MTASISRNSASRPRAARSDDQRAHRQPEIQQRERRGRRSPSASRSDAATGQRHERNRPEHDERAHQHDVEQHGGADDAVVEPDRRRHADDVSNVAAPAGTRGSGRPHASDSRAYSTNARSSSSSAVAKNSHDGASHTTATATAMSTAPLRTRVIIGGRWLVAGGRSSGGSQSAHFAPSATGAGLMPP